MESSCQPIYRNHNFVQLKFEPVEQTPIIYSLTYTVVMSNGKPDFKQTKLISGIIETSSKGLLRIPVWWFKGFESQSKIWIELKAIDSAGNRSKGVKAIIPFAVIDEQ